MNTPGPHSGPLSTWEVYVLPGPALASRRGQLIPGGPRRLLSAGEVSQGTARDCRSLSLSDAGASRSWWFGGLVVLGSEWCGDV